MNRVWLYFVLVVVACTDAPHQGFKEVEAGVFLKYHVLGEGEELVHDGDSVHVRVRMAASGEAPGSMLSTERWFAAEDLRSGAMAPVLKRVHEGDSISVIAQAASLPWDVLSPPAMVPPPSATLVQLEFALLQVRTPEQIEVEQERHRQADPEGYERKLIAAFMERTGHTWQQWGTSILQYRISGKASDTSRVRQGEQVEVNWRGSRLEDGVMIDETQGDAGVFTFRYGDQDQVIKGLETAVMLLREGQEGEFIFPSEMAFGVRGVPGLVEPGSPLRYVVKLERVHRR